MKISQKLFICFAVIVTPITLFSIFTINSVRREMKEIEDFHTQHLYTIQNLATGTIEAVEESFAYVVSGHKAEKEDFLAWAKQIKETDKQFKELEIASPGTHNDLAEKEFDNIVREQANLISKAKALFQEFESKGQVSDQVFTEYEYTVDNLLNHYKEIIKQEKQEVHTQQEKAIYLIENTLRDLTTLGLLTIVSSITSSYFIAKSISNPVKKLNVAMLEVAKGNLDNSIEQNSKDEIGDLANSFSQMTKDLKKFREDLVSAKNYTNNIIKSMNDALIVISPIGSIITINNASCMLLRCLEDEIIGQPIEHIFVEKEILYNEAHLDNLIQTGSASHIETKFLAKDGSQVDVSFTTSLMLDEQGEIQGIVCVAQDITERKRVEAEIHKALEKEKQLSELKSRFVTTTSHEFRTPLTTILSSTELLQDYGAIWSEEKKSQHFQRITSTVKYMTQLLNDVLLVSKAEVGKLEFKPAPLDLIQFCQNLVEEIQDSSQKHTITFMSQGDCTNACIDEKLLRHILSNLLSNAVKYSPQGDRVNFDLVCQQGEAVFRIQDRGIGIPVADQVELFNSFHRANNVGTIAGTGLGLAIVKKSVDLHGGNISFTSEVGVGTTFQVTLPLNNSVVSSLSASHL